MRGLVAVALAGVALVAGCTGFEEYDPMKIACDDPKVQQAGWCDGSVDIGGLSPPTGEGNQQAAPQGPRIETTADGVAWSHDLSGFHGRFSFGWESPGRATLGWSGAGSGGMAIALRDAQGNPLYTSGGGAAGGSEVLAGRAGSWTVDLDFDNFSGHATVGLQRT
jgi:hypothetical protein